MGYNTTEFTGLTINGAVLLPSYGGNLQSVRGLLPTGIPLYVSSAGGANGYGDGTNITMPLSTITAALTKLNNRQNKGDCIYVLPGHTESVSSADYFSATGTANGFSVVGLGSGAQRPTLNWTTATSTWLIDTAGVEIANMNLNLAGSSTTGALTVATPITVSAAGCRILGCEINWGQDTDSGCGSTLGAIAVVAGTRFEFLNNYCPNYDTAGTLAVTFMSCNGADDLVFAGNYVFGGTTATTVGPLHFVTTASKRIKIVSNNLENLKASSTKALTSAVANVTGFVVGNNFRVQSGIVAETIAGTPFLCSFYGNSTNNTDTKSGAADVANGASA